MAKDRAPGPRFHTTRWSLIAAANQSSSTEAKAALAALCELYWYPLYTFIRRLGHDADDARDITQAFFVTLLEKKSLRAADRLYRLEAYTPAAKRKLGYYALPLLWRDRVIGWGNVAVKNGELRCECGYVGSPPADRAFRRELQAEVERMRRFLRREE